MVLLPTRATRSLTLKSLPNCSLFSFSLLLTRATCSLPQSSVESKYAQFSTYPFPVYSIFTSYQIHALPHTWLLANPLPDFFFFTFYQIHVLLGFTCRIEKTLGCLPNSSLFFYCFLLSTRSTYSLPPSSARSASSPPTSDSSTSCRSGAPTKYFDLYV